MLATRNFYPHSRSTNEPAMSRQCRAPEGFDPQRWIGNRSRGEFKARGRIRRGRGLTSLECVLPVPPPPRYKTAMTEPASHPASVSADIDAAARVVAPFAVKTPLLSFPVLNERVGTKVFLKPEMLQR